MRISGIDAMNHTNRLGNRGIRDTDLSRKNILIKIMRYNTIESMDKVIDVSDRMSASQQKAILRCKSNTSAV